MATTFGNSKFLTNAVPLDGEALLRLTTLQKFAEDNGFELMESKWKGVKKKHLFRNIETKSFYEGVPDNIFKNGFPKDARSADEKRKDLSRLAEKHGFELLESEWLGSAIKHRFKHISSGVLYEGRPNYIKIKGFPADLRTSNDRFMELSVFSNTHGFELLESEWLGSKTKHRFKNIKSGIMYEGFPGLLAREGFPKDIQVHLKRPVDINANLAKLKELGKYASLHGFELLEDTWLGVVPKYKFRHLESGLIYEGRPYELKKNGFPGDLRTDTERLSDLSKYAIQHGFELLDTKWLGTMVKYQFKHQVTGKLYSGASTIQRTGFPKDLRTQEDRWSELSAYSIEHGFKLLENEWLGFNTVHKFEHLNTGDIYEWTPSTAYRGFPAVRGQRFVTEEVCRQIMQHIFGGEFRSDMYRLAGLHGKNIQLDGLENFLETPDIFRAAGSVIQVNKKPWDSHESLTEIAFEFQGHHAHLENYAVIERDQLRIDYCRTLGILLVIIDPPEDWAQIRNSEYMFNHVCNAVRASVTTTSALQFKPGFQLNLRDWQPDLEAYAKLSKLATENEFELLDERWNGAKFHYKFKSLETNNVYEWEASRLMRFGFPKDLRTNVDRFNHLVEYSLKNGFEVIDSEWRGLKKRHTFKSIETGKLYAWLTHNIIGRGFPKKLRTDAERLKILSQKANSHGFKLLETQWLGGKTKHQFKHLDSGTLYQAMPGNVLNHGFPKSLLKTLSVHKLSLDVNIVKTAREVGDLFFDIVPNADSFLSHPIEKNNNTEVPFEDLTLSISK